MRGIIRLWSGLCRGHLSSEERRTIGCKYVGTGSAELEFIVNTDVCVETAEGIWVLTVVHIPMTPDDCLWWSAPPLLGYLVMTIHRSLNKMLSAHRQVWCACYTSKTHVCVICSCLSWGLKKNRGWTTTCIIDFHTPTAVSDFHKAQVICL